jgi:hypothetical protein
LAANPGPNISMSSGQNPYLKPILRVQEGILVCTHICIPGSLNLCVVVSEEASRKQLTLQRVSKWQSEYFHMIKNVYKYFSGPLDNRPQNMHLEALCYQVWDCTNWDAAKAFEQKQKRRPGRVLSSETLLTPSRVITYSRWSDSSRDHPREYPRARLWWECILSLDILYQDHCSTRADAHAILNSSPEPLTGSSAFGL